MCGGGGRPTIAMPDTKGYDRLLGLQIAAMQQAQSSAVTTAQGVLNAALQQEQQVLGSLRDVRVQQANETAANAQRIAALLGPPPPEKTASAPVIGADRTTASARTGRRQLRVDRAGSGATPAKGAGLNL